MKILNVKLFFTLLACLYLQQAKSQIWAIDGDDGNNVEFEYKINDEGHAHLAVHTVNAEADTIIGASMALESTGQLVLGIGTEDPCAHFAEDEYNGPTYLVVRGDAFKQGDAMWNSTSDKRLKKNIAPLKKSANKFNDINFYRYEYKKSGKMRYGIMAQEVKDDFPHSVGTFWEGGTEYYTFNPNNLFFMGMKVIQENSQKAIEQEAQIRTLETQLTAEKNRNHQLAADIEAIKAALANAGIDLPVSPASELESRSAAPENTPLKSDTPKLQQNIPNPFQKSTTIPYYLPTHTQQASLVIHDMTGKVVANYNLSTQKGQGNIEIDLSHFDLKGGIYTYSLYVNKQLIATQKMSVLRK